MRLSKRLPLRGQPSDDSLNRIRLLFAIGLERAERDRPPVFAERLNVLAAVEDEPTVEGVRVDQVGFGAGSGDQQ